MGISGTRDCYLLRDVDLWRKMSLYCGTSERLLLISSVPIMTGAMTFEDMLIYLWEEWGFLDEVQRCLYHNVNRKNFALYPHILTGQGTHTLPGALI